MIREFIKGQESGELKNINGLEIKEKDISSLIEIKKKFDCWKLRYDACNGVSDVNEVVYPGFGDLYNLFEIFFGKLVIWYKDSDSDSDIEDFDIILPDSDDDSDSDKF